MDRDQTYRKVAQDQDHHRAMRQLRNTMTETDETRHQISESADKIVLKTSVKRGSGTRDQDKLDVKIKGADPAETAERLAETLSELEAQGVANTLRETQPEDGE